MEAANWSQFRGTVMYVFVFFALFNVQSAKAGGGRFLKQSQPGAGDARRQLAGGIAGDLGGMTLAPGTYTAAAAIGLTGTLTLDAGNNVDASWYFNIGGALTTAAASKMVFFNNVGKQANVLWVVTGAITTGAGSTTIGTMEASGTITLGADTVNGALDARGAITVGAGAVYLSATSVGAFTLGAGAHASNEHPDLPGDLIGMTLAPGTYKTAAATGLSGLLILDAGGVAGAEWTFKIGGALATAAASNMMIINVNSQASVLWEVTGAISLGASSTAVGRMVSYGAINLGAMAKSGALKAGGAITVGAGAVFESASSVGALTLGAGAHAVGELPDLPADMGGMTLAPGTYKTAAATGLTGVLILDAGNNPSAKWEFKIGGALATAAASNMKIINCPIINCPQASVDWLVTGAISLGASSTALGSMVSFGAITLGAMATSGALNAGGAITVGAGAVYVSVSSVGALTLGAGSHKVGELPDLPADMGGMTLAPGTYKTAAATGLTGILTLAGGPQDKWTFHIGGTLTTAAASKMILTNGGNVHWEVTGAISLGASSTALGSMISYGAITLGALATSGALDAGGAITVGAGALDAGGSAKSVGALTLGAGAHAVGELPDLPADMGGMILAPGTYKTAAATGLTGTLTLDGTGVSNPEWTFIIGGALTAAAASKMLGGTDANVKWVVTGAITTGASSTVIGSMKSSGAITVGALATCGALTAEGAITVGAGAIYGSVNTFAGETIGAGAIKKV